MSATCKVCGTTVGCNCQLINGMCAYCAGKAKNENK